NLDQTFFRLLEERLNRTTTERWEVVNVGVGDFGTAQEWLALTRFGLPLAPDVVLLQIFPLNDVCNNSIELFDLCRSKNDPYRPYLIDAESGLILTSAQPVRNFLRRHLKIYGVVE